ncbi:MAG: universal stress protein [Halobacteriota archaeon]
MYTVLIAADPDQDSATVAAEAVTNLPGGDDELEIVVLNVQREFETPDEGARVSSDEFYEATEFPRSVEVLTEILESAGLTATKRREHGDPAEEILAVAAEIDVDAIVMGSRKRSPTGKAIFGSVTQSVLLDADCPVTVVTHE